MHPRSGQLAGMEGCQHVHADARRRWQRACAWPSARPRRRRGSSWPASSRRAGACCAAWGALLSLAWVPTGHAIGAQVPDVECPGRRYVDEDGVVTLKGRVAAAIQSADELVLTELIFNSGFKVLELWTTLKVLLWELPLKGEVWRRS